MNDEIKIANIPLEASPMTKTPAKNRKKYINE